MAEVIVIMTKTHIFAAGLEGQPEWDFGILTTQNQENQV